MGTFASVPFSIFVIFTSIHTTTIATLLLMANKTVSFRLPTELVEAIEAQAKATGQSKTNVVIAALAKFYGCPYSQPKSVTPEQFQQQLNELKYQVARLSEANELQQLLMGTTAPIKLDPEVDAVIGSMPTADRWAWVHRMLTEAARKELLLQTMEPSISGDHCLMLVSPSKG